MVCDEAPAATHRGFNGNGVCDRSEIGSAKQPASIPRNSPASFVAAEIHLGHWPAGICDTLAALQHSSCVPDRAAKNMMNLQMLT
jgi:hypothetical protein